MTTLLVTSTEEGTGKTAIAIALAKLAQDRGAEVGYMKPKGTRLESTVGKTRDEDPMLAREVLDLDGEMHQLEPVVYSPTFIKEALRGREDQAELSERIESEFSTLSEETDVMILEGGGRLWTGGIVDLTDIDVAELLDAKLLVVSQYSEPGDVDELLYTAERIGDRLSGVLYNQVAASDLDDLSDIVTPFLGSRDIDHVGTIPFDESLAGLRVSELADAIGAQNLTPDIPTTGRIERFTVGAMSANAALGQFRQTSNGAVITGGDRADIQTAALEAPGVNCLILTGGYEPSSAILGKATQREVPVLLVKPTMRPTIDQMERVLRSGRTQRVETVERMKDLLEERIAIGELLELD